MSEAEFRFLRAVELRLLRCTLSQSPPPPPPPQSPIAHQPNSLHLLIETLVDSIERGNYAEALSSDAVRLVFAFSDSWEFDDSIDCATRFYGEVERSVELFLRNNNDADFASRCALLMCVGIAALLAFTQQNVTGPVGNFSPFPLVCPRSNKDENVSGGGQWDMWARCQLTSNGCDLLGKFSLLQYIVYSKLLLSKTKDLLMEGRNSCLSGIRSVSWWLCRLILLQQRILDGMSSSLYELLQVFMNETLDQFGKFENVIGYWGSELYEGEALTIVSMAQLETGVIQHTYGRVDSSRLHLNYAEEACGLHLSVTGALGFRTIHQVDPKAQMVLVANTGQLKNSGGPTECSEVQSVSSVSEDKRTLHPHGNYESCDILITPTLVENGKVGGLNGKVDDIGKDGTSPLTAIQQAVVLAQCLHHKRSCRDDELSRWEMAPFIEAIDAQQQSYFIIRCFCDILRIRWESTRSRTKQRALLMMDKLVEVVYKASPGAVAAQRIQFSYGVCVPTIPALRKEYGELLVSCGVTGEALGIFEDLELWDNLIYCYQLLGKKAAAVDLIKERLCDMPNDPRLWCSLGDVTNSDAYYEKALEVSNNKSTRAMRSLARSAYNRGDYETSKTLWESAMALNSLHPDGWFALGAAALKARDIDKALDSFTRAVQLDPENGEAWNNIAGLHVIKKKSKQAFIAYKEALKFRRTNWQLWENYSHVAMDIGNFSQALEATKMVLDLSSNKRVDVELLEKLMQKVEEKTFKSPLSSGHVLEDHNNYSFEVHTSHSSTDSTDESGYSESVMENPRETKLFVDMLGNILQKVIRSVGGADIWGLYARWQKIKGNLTMCSESLLKQVRSYQGSDLWHDQDRFKKFSQASLQLCKVYMEIASSTGSRRELTAAEMHLRNSVKQAVNFSDTEEFRELQACLDDVKKRLDAASSESA